MTSTITTREPTLLTDFYEGEVRDITFPCAASLDAGESIVDATIQLVFDHGITDSNPAAHIAEPRQIVGTNVVQRVSASFGGAWYRLWGEIETSTGRHLIGEGMFYVKPSPF